MSLSKIFITLLHLFWIQSTSEDFGKMWLCELDIAYIVTPILHKGEQKYGVYTIRTMSPPKTAFPPTFAFKSSWGVTEINANCKHLNISRFYYIFTTHKEVTVKV